MSEKETNGKESYVLLQTIYDNLPVGLELYDSEGNLTEINHAGMAMMGVTDKKNMLGINIFQNPNIPDDMKDRLRQGENVRFTVGYDFSLAREKYYPTTHTGVRHLEITVSVVKQNNGGIDKYIFVAQDVTTTVQVEKELRQNKQKTELAMKASGFALWEFDTLKQVFLAENEPLNNYDKTRPLDLEAYYANMHEADLPQAHRAGRLMLEGRDEPFTIDVRLRFPGKSEWQYCTVNGVPYEKDATGKVVKYVGFRKDNTELEKRKQLQEKILNNIPLPIHIKDVEDNFRYVFCNEESQRMFDTHEGETVYNIIDQQQGKQMQKTDLEVFTTGKPYLGLERITLKDGRVYDTIVRKNIIYDGDKRLLLNIRWDQSLQNELKRRAKVLSISMEAMDAYTWFFEPQKGRVSFGEGFDKIGRDASEVNSLEKFLACIHPDDRELFAGTLEEVGHHDSGEWKVEYRIDLRGNGVYEWWETRGVLETSILNDAPYQYVSGMSINIEAHKQAELTLLKNKEELDKLIRQNELVLNNTNSGLAYIDKDYIVQWENISMCSASLSYEAYKKGVHCYESAHNRRTPCENCVMQRAMQSRQMEQIQFRLSNKRAIEVLATPVFNDGHTLDGIVIRVDDITERERMIEELRQAKLLAEQSDKLKSAFLANMSHEIRTPLNAIVGFSDLLMTTEDKDEREEYMHIIHTNNELLLKLISDILDLSKLEAGSVELKYEDFNLSEYFNDLASSMKQRVTNPNVRLIAVNPYRTCRVKSDKNRIAQVITNYVTNAIKYTPKGFIEMGYEQVDEGIRLYVKDSGIGIAEEKKVKVFHRFEKLDEFAQGTGLGLSICKAITEAMGGSVGFESTYGEGSQFWAILPCDPEILDATPEEARTVAARHALDETPAFSAKRPTILIAEDITSNFLLISALLRRHFNVLHALNGREAVEMAKNNPPDLILMDMKMPEMDGLTATAEIRKFRPNLPIVALTAHAFESDKTAALRAGCNEYLVKPIDKAHLMAVLRKFCRNVPGLPEG